MNIDVGYPDWIMDDAKLDEKYEGVSCFGAATGLTPFFMQVARHNHARPDGHFKVWFHNERYVYEGDK